MAHTALTDGHLLSADKAFEGGLIKLPDWLLLPGQLQQQQRQLPPAAASHASDDQAKPEWILRFGQLAAIRCHLDAPCLAALDFVSTMKTKN